MEALCEGASLPCVVTISAQDAESRRQRTAAGEGEQQRGQVPALPGDLQHGPGGVGQDGRRSSPHAAARSRPWTASSEVRVDR